MSQGLMCLTCRRYIYAEGFKMADGTDPKHGCKCEKPRPSWDGKTEEKPR